MKERHIKTDDTAHIHIQRNGDVDTITIDFVYLPTNSPLAIRHGFVIHKSHAMELAAHLVQLAHDDD